VGLLALKTRIMDLPVQSTRWTSWIFDAWKLWVSPGPSTVWLFCRRI